MKEKAIEYLKFHRKIFCDDHLKVCPKESIAYQATLKEKEFYDMAIEALEKEPCEDCISRQAVIDALRDAENHAFNTYYKGLVKAHKIIVGLPSVIPHYTEAEIQKMQEMEQAEIQKAYELGKVEQPKIGHWNTYVVSNRGIDEEWLECSECMWSNALVIPRNYCPNCGARMIESEV